MKILLTGANGQVGTEFRRAGEALGQIVAVTRAELDLSREGSIRSFVRESRPDVIVNAAAYTAVDRAESEPDLCFAINATAPGVLAEEAASLGAILLHYSTDYVFDGSKSGAYLESDPVAPLGVYGRSKVEGEAAIAAVGVRAVSLRTSWVYSLHGRNFLLTMLRLAKEKPELRVVDDQIGAPTSAKAIAEATVRLIEENAARVTDFPAGVYHMTARGSTSWCGFTRAIVDRVRGRAGFENLARVVAISTAEYPTPARRPANSMLANNKFEETFGFRLAGWERQLDEVLVELPS